MLEIHDPHKIHGIIETLPLTPKDEEYLERNSEVWESFLQHAENEQRLVVSNPIIFSVLIGLNPEGMVPSESEAAILQKMFDSPSMRGEFAILQMVSPRQQFSIINIERAKAILHKHAATIKAVANINTQGSNGEFLDSLICAFEATQPQDQELMYGLLSGFPLTAAVAWSEAKAKTNDTISFKYTKLNQQALHSQRFPFSFPEKPTDYAREEQFWTVSMPHIKSSPWVYVKPSSIKNSNATFPTYNPGGLFGIGFRFAQEGEQDPELQDMYARYNFVYLTLGWAQELKQVHTQASEEWDENRAVNSTLPQRLFFRLDQALRGNQEAT